MERIRIAYLATKGFQNQIEWTGENKSVYHKNELSH